MRKLVLKNGIKLIYEKTETKLTSISISLGAGAVADGEKLGLAHATEHMVFKGTKKRTEKDVNEEFGNIFGFHNAMTNYPYVVYYGTLLEEDFHKGIELLSDILINPIFPVEGFKEEMNTIVEELKEWDEELSQYCEDKLFFHSFNRSRLKYPIIGRHEDLISIRLDDIKEFHKKYYTPQNATIAIVSSLDFEEIRDIVEGYFGIWSGVEVESDENIELPIGKINYDYREGINSCRIQIIYPLSEITEEEIGSFMLFNELFGDGTNSILYDNLRTKNGLVYDVLTAIVNDKHIRLYKIMFSISEDNIDKALGIVNQCIEDIPEYKGMITEKKIIQLAKGVKLKKLFKEEQSVRRANVLSCSNVMHGNAEIQENIFNGLEEIDKESILLVGAKVLKNPAIEIIIPR